jgi:NTE family protein
MDSGGVAMQEEYEDRATTTRRFRKPCYTAPAMTDRHRTLREWLREAPFALGLSSGFFGFFAHAGFMTALEDEGLLPTHLSGSSAGALVAGLWAAGVDAPRIGDELVKVERDHFWDPGVGFGLLRGARFRSRLEGLLPVEAFEKTRRPLLVSVFDVWTRRTRVAKSGPLAIAIHASCAVPFLFHPVMLDGRPTLDGGVGDRPGIEGLPREGRVLFHHLPSKSPWRTAVPFPRRDDLVAVAIEGLPRLGPFALERGRDAFTMARARMKLALAHPIENAIVAV